MANQIILKQSSVANSIPTVGDLVFGELAVNTADGKVYFKVDSGGGETIAMVGTGTGTPGATGLTGATGVNGTDGATGPQGATGTAGATGAAIVIIGSVPDVNVAPPGNPQTTLNTAFPGAVAGNGVIDQTLADLWVYDGALWSNVGQILGPQGATGLTGATGSGATGATGPQGATGTAGANGATGVNGLTGATGSGATGATGPQGATGLQGATGSGATGTIGATGQRGATGFSGATGVGATGPSGPGNVLLATDTSDNSIFYPVFVPAVGSNQTVYADDSNLRYIPQTGVIYSSAMSLTGNITCGNASIASGNITGSQLISTVDLSATGNISGNILTSQNSITGTSLSVAAGSVTAGNIINGNGGNGVGNIGSSSKYFNTVFAQATTALYADLAECYTADADYEPGTVVMFGGTAEITVCNQDSCPQVSGVVSTNPAYKMNAGLESDHVVTIALMGRVPVKVKGPVKAGAMMVSAGNGQARSEINPAMGTVIGKAVQNFEGDSGIVEIVVGRL
jgi:hypothetical protein